MIVCLFFKDSLGATRRVAACQFKAKAYKQTYKQDYKQWKTFYCNDIKASLSSYLKPRMNTVRDTLIQKIDCT